MITVPRRVGVAIAAVAVPGLTWVLTHLGDLSLASVVLLYLVVVVMVAATGGVWLAIATAVISDLVVNWFFVPPFHTLTVEQRDHVVTLAVYVLVATAVSVAVDLAVRHRAAAARTGVEAALLARITSQPVEERSLTVLLEHIRDTFGMTRVALVESGTTIESAGEPSSGEPGISVPASEDITLETEGPPVIAADRRLLGRLASAAARILEAQRLSAEAARARELAEVDKLRTALLVAVGHDLRTPLAGIKVAVSSLRQPDVEWTPAEHAELLLTIEECADRLDTLVENLLAMSRLQAGVLSADLHPTSVDEVLVKAALDPGGAHLRVDVAEDVVAIADAGLLERVIANLLANASRVSPVGVTLSARYAGPYVDISVIDHGPGVPPRDRDRMFEPFQRLGDRDATVGLGLGLAIARGFTEAMGGTLSASDTLGGGLTMTVRLAAAQ